MERQIFNEIVKWQDATFQQATAASYSKHLLQELEELADAVVNGDSFQVESEMADCFILLFGLAHKLNFSYDYLATIIHEKHEVNLRRKWGQPDADGVVEHVEEAPPAQPEQPNSPFRVVFTKEEMADYLPLSKKWNGHQAMTPTEFVALLQLWKKAGMLPGIPVIGKLLQQTAQDDDDTDEDDYTTCDECDQPDACADHGCAIKAGLRMGNPW